MLNTEIIKFEKWQQYLNIDTSPVKFHKIPFKCCKDKNLQWFQCRINYRILGTNYVLEKMKIKPSNVCGYCKNYPETIQHLFCECVKVTPFWNNFKNLFQQCSKQILEMNKTDIIFGNLKFDNILNTALILAKQYIFRYRTSGAEPNIMEFKQVFKYHYEIENKIALKYLNIDKFNSNWIPYNTIVTHIQSL
jgi:hypothetical protein